MREIKFRGLRIDGKGWVYGYVDYNEYNNIAVIHSDASTTQVIPETVGQFTGLTDKNGKEIYEGDKLINSKREVGLVVWYEAGFHLECNRRNGSTFYIPLDKGFLQNKEIIGNIHEKEEYKL